MKLRLIVVGRDRNEPICDQAAEYIGRIGRYYPAELVELKEEPAKASTPVDRVRKMEAERLRKAIGESDHLVALDEHGKELSSIDIARRIERYGNEGKQAVSFVIGGPNGLDPQFLREAKEIWSLSKMTLPHRIARLILAEQLYRACTIIRGEPYHK
jgi:23S rRNA (pseudouridine1915-N3)-methyltransferase